MKNKTFKSLRREPLFIVAVNDTEGLNAADKMILAELESGVRNPSWLADAAGYHRQYVYQRLQVLEREGYVENIGHGLYELTE